MLANLEFVEKLDTYITVEIPQSHGGEFRCHIPLHTNDLRVGLGYVRNVSESDVVCYLLLQRHARARLAVASGERRIDLELTQAENPLHTAGKRVRDGLAEDGGFAHLRERLLRGRRLLSSDVRI